MEENALIWIWLIASIVCSAALLVGLGSLIYVCYCRFTKKAVRSNLTGSAIVATFIGLAGTFSTIPKFLSFLK